MYSHTHSGLSQSPWYKWTEDAFLEYVASYPCRSMEIEQAEAGHAGHVARAEWGQCWFWSWSGNSLYSFSAWLMLVYSDAESPGYAKWWDYNELSVAKSASLHRPLMLSLDSNQSLSMPRLLRDYCSWAFQAEGESGFFHVFATTPNNHAINEGSASSSFVYIFLERYLSTRSPRLDIRLCHLHKLPLIVQAIIRGLWEHFQRYCG